MWIVCVCVMWGGKLGVVPLKITVCRGNTPYPSTDVKINNHHKCVCDVWVGVCSILSIRCAIQQNIAEKALHILQAMKHYSDAIPNMARIECLLSNHIYWLEWINNYQYLYWCGHQCNVQYNGHGEIDLCVCMCNSKCVCVCICVYV